MIRTENIYKDIMVRELGKLIDYYTNNPDTIRKYLYDA